MKQGWKQAALVAMAVCTILGSMALSIPEASATAQAATPAIARSAAPGSARVATTPPPSRIAGTDPTTQPAMRRAPLNAPSSERPRGAAVSTSTAEKRSVGMLAKTLATAPVAGASAAAGDPADPTPATASAGIGCAQPYPDQVGDGSGHVLALGDSYSSGEGLGGTFIAGCYLEPTDTSSNQCHRSHYAYSGYVRPNEGHDFYACSGAVTKDVLGSTSYWESNQISQVSSNYDTVTLTIGGNDVGFANIVKACVSQTPDVDAVNDFVTDDRTNVVGDCDFWLSAAQKTLGAGGARFATTLANTYNAILGRMGRTARLVIGTYPVIFPNVGTYTGAVDFGGNFCVAADLGVFGKYGYKSTRISQMAALQATMNAAIRQAVQRIANTGDTRIKLADVAATYPDHTISCGDSGRQTPYVNGILVSATSNDPNHISTASFHPPVAGQQAMGTLFQAAATSAVNLSTIAPDPLDLSVWQYGRLGINLSAVGGNGSYTWSLVGGSLPAGVQLDPNGFISGTVTSDQDATFTVQVSSGSQIAIRQITVDVMQIAPCNRLYIGWSSSPGSAWDQPDAWSPTGAPGASDFVCLDLGWSHYLPIDGDRTLGGLRAHGTGSISVMGHLTLTDATNVSDLNAVTVTGTLTVAPGASASMAGDTILEAQGRIDGGGTVGVAADGYLYGPSCCSPAYLGANLVNNGTIVLRGGDLVLADGVTLTNNGTITGYGRILTESGSVVQIVNHGEITADGNMSVLAPIVNSGVVGTSWPTDSLTLGDTSGPGQFVGSGSLVFQGTHTGGDYTQLGRLDVPSGSFDLPPASYPFLHEVNVGYGAVLTLPAGTFPSLATANVNNGTLRSNGDATLKGAVNLNGGVLGGPLGTLILAQNATVTAWCCGNELNGPVVNNGTFVTKGYNAVLHATFTNNGSVAGYGSFTRPTGDESTTFVNNGTVSAGDPAYVNGSGLSVSLPVVNNGTMTTRTATDFLTVSTASGSGSYEGPGTIQFNDGATGGRFTGLAQLTLAAGNLTLPTDSYPNLHKVAVSSGVLTLAPGTYSGMEDVSVYSSAVVATPTDVTIPGNVTMNGGAIGGAGVLTFPSGGQATLSGGELIGRVVNNATIAMMGSTTRLRAELTNNGTIRGYGSFTRDVASLPARIVNNGSVIGGFSPGSYGVTLDVSVPTVNNGTITTNAGTDGVTLDVTSGPGEYRGPGTISFRSDVSGGVFTNLAQLTVASGTLTLPTAAYPALQKLTVSGGTLTIPGGTYSGLQETTISSGVLDTPSDVTIPGDISMYGAAIGGSGTVTFAAGATTNWGCCSSVEFLGRIVNNGSFHVATGYSITLRSTFTNNGTFSGWGSVGRSYSSIPAAFVNNGTVTGGDLNYQYGVGITFSVPFVNNGTLTTLRAVDYVYLAKASGPGQYRGPGTVGFTDTVTGGVFTDLAQLTIQGGKLTLPDGAYPNLHSITLSGGVLTLPSGPFSGLLTTSLSSGVLDTPHDVTLPGSTSVYNTAIGGAGTVTFPSTAVVTFGCCYTSELLGRVVNDGTFGLGNGYNLVLRDRFINNGTVSGWGSLTRSFASIPAEFVNNGVLAPGDATRPYQVDISMGVPFTNNGVIAVGLGGLYIGEAMWFGPSSVVRRVPGDGALSFARPIVLSGRLEVQTIGTTQAGTTLVVAHGDHLAGGFSPIVGSAQWQGVNTGTAYTVNASVTSVDPPLAPSGLIATSQIDGVHLSWTAGGGDANGFEIQRARFNATTATWGEWTTLSTDASQTTYLDVAPDGKYAYLVRAVNVSGGSAWTAPVVLVHSTATQVPQGPTGLVLASNGSDVEVTWTDDAVNETGYEVQRARWVAGVWSEWTAWSLDANATHFTDHGVSDGFYAYLVRATNFVGPSAWAITVIEHTTASAPPAAPTGLVATNSGATVELSWVDNSSNEHLFEVGRARFDYTTHTWGDWSFWPVDRNGTSFVDTAPADAQYAYLVRSRNPIGASDWAITVINHTNTTSVPAPPSAFTAVAIGGGVSLTWTDQATNEVLYEVQRATWDGSSWAGWTTTTLERNTTHHVDAVPSGKYAYLLRATNSNGSSEWVTVTVTA